MDDVCDCAFTTIIHASVITAIHRHYPPCTHHTPAIHPPYIHHAPAIQDMSNEIQEALGTSYATPEMDDDELMDELDALEGELLDEALGEEGPSYLTVCVAGWIMMWGLVALSCKMLHMQDDK